MNLKRIAARVLWLQVIAGCVSVPQFAPAKVGIVYPQRTPAEKIELFRSQMPVKKYFEVGSVSACCNIRTERLVDMMRAMAAEKGGDALIGLDVTGDGTAMATVIRYE
jgi:hypothetical protein